MPPNLKTVDRLTITFLVDNTIEWRELQQHVNQPGHGVYDEEKKVPVLDFDNFCCGAHGFAALIETFVEGEETSHLTLFDTGPDSQSLVRNIRAMQTPTEKIERVITSHWHSDHTGGLLSFLELRRAKFQSAGLTGLACIVDVHPNRPILRGIAPGPHYDKVLCALPPDPTFEEIEQLGGVLEKHAEGHAVSGDTIWVSGEIPRVTEYESGILGGMRWVSGSGSGESGKWIFDRLIMDERYAAIDVAGKGLVVFSSCSHAGIVNVVKDAINMFARPIYMVIGGLHLAGPEFGPRIPVTVEFLSKTLRPAPAFILPMHCSGFQAKVALENAFGEGCVPAGAGHKVNIVGHRADEMHLVSPVY
ncbi:unnamed protein product [Cyclocybe aegerita]|uniref:Metallo-beta-lactamase domain-containing protein n=1 Tax=Cyclocybe aegerita TaxID=1973307 RepID=A0A8S0W6F9_CYCAE|nr:unnamed protein product [Cyclocybe aegerita]